MPRIVFLMTAIAIASSGWAATADTERARIDAAIVRVEKSNLTFIRNGAEHTAAEAAGHMRDKLKLAGSAVKTYDDFVEKVASKSSLTGKPYLVKFSDGKTKEVGKWLRESPTTEPAGSEGPR